MKILYVGWGMRGGTSMQRERALRDIGASTVVVDLTQPAPRGALEKLAARALRAMYGLRDRCGANAAILARVREQPFDIVWIDKGSVVSPDTLREIKRLQPAAWIAGYTPDDLRPPTNGTPWYRAGLPLYDSFFTTKSYQVPELRALGCRAVHFIGNAFDPHTHRPLEVSAAQRAALGGPVGFVGTRERERTRSMEFLAANGIEVRIWGPRWERYRPRSRGMRIERTGLWGDDYARAVCAFDINLAFLRKGARDLQTTRTMEIPACGGFMLAERTVEHQALFQEGLEADYFSSDRELLEKTRYYLEHPERRLRIAAAGHERCLRGYSNQDRMRTMLAVIDEGRGQRGREAAAAAGGVHA